MNNTETFAQLICRLTWIGVSIHIDESYSNVPGVEIKLKDKDRSISTMLSSSHLSTFTDQMFSEFIDMLHKRMLKKYDKSKTP